MRECDFEDGVLVEGFGEDGTGGAVDLQAGGRFIGAVDVDGRGGGGEG